MCGRIVNALGEVQVQFYELNGIRLSYRPTRNRYNVAPTTQVPVVREIEGSREMLEIKWGLRPSWAKPEARLPLMHNARAETVATLASYRSAFKSRRCLVAASGYYEWRVDGKQKQPFYFTRADSHPMAFAGIWEKNSDVGETVSIITTTPNKEAAAVHDRMPVILRREFWKRWFEPDQLTEAEKAVMLVPAPDGKLALWPVPREVGSVRNDNPGLIEPVALEVPKTEPPPDLFQLNSE